MNVEIGLQFKSTFTGVIRCIFTVTFKGPLVQFSIVPMLYDKERNVCIHEVIRYFSSMAKLNYT